jgi:hypothetical protein
MVAGSNPVTSFGTFSNGVSGNLQLFVDTYGADPSRTFMHSANSAAWYWAYYNGTGYGLQLVPGADYGWAGVNSLPDTAVGRTAAGVVEANNGTSTVATGGAFREFRARSYTVGGAVISGCSAGTQTGGGTAGTFTSGTTGACTIHAQSAARRSNL